MPLLAGESLEARLGREGRLPLADLLRIGRETAEDWRRRTPPAWCIGTSSRTTSGWSAGPAAPPPVRVLDFGLARAREGDAALTSPGVRGDAGLRGPEQAAAGRSMPGPTCSAWGASSTAWRRVSCRSAAPTWRRC